MTDPLAGPTGRFQAAWEELEPPARRALELAEALPAGWDRIAAAARGLRLRAAT